MPPKGPKGYSVSDAVHPNPDVSALLTRVYSLHKKDVDFRLYGGDYEALLHDLGDPHLRLPPVVHVAGTNGKGSTLAFLRSLLEGVGKTVHVLTSPHLLQFNERIILAGREITDDTLLHYLRRVWDEQQNREVTFFEFTTALAFLVMAETPADYCLVEVGCGGRLDATNIIPNPIATGITAIGYDHQEWLGDTLPKIAGEKAGIMKPNAPCVIGHQPYAKQVMPVFTQTAQAQSCPLSVCSTPYEGEIGLAGSHQSHNAAMALALYNQIPNLSPAPLESLKTVTWKGRMECVYKDDLRDIWFDGAHNESGAKIVAEQLKTWRETNPDQPIHLAIALGSNKNASAFTEPLNGLYDHLHTLPLKHGPKPQTAQDLAKKLTNAKASDLTILKTLKGRILICGSLYFYQELTNL